MYIGKVVFPFLTDLLTSQAAGRSPSQNRSAMAIHLFSLPALSHGRRLMESPKPLPGFGLFFPKKSPIFWGPLSFDRFPANELPEILTPHLRRPAFGGALALRASKISDFLGTPPILLGSAQTRRGAAPNPAAL